jgi:hypothetical protein
MSYTAILKNHRTKTENGVETVIYYYRIPALKGTELEQYKADRGQYYLECEETGHALFFVTGKPLGPKIEVTRSMKPNKLGTHSWYAKRTVLQIMNDLAGQYKFLAVTESGMSELRQMAKDIYTCEAVPSEMIESSGESDSGIDTL